MNISDFFTAFGIISFVVVMWFGLGFVLSRLFYSPVSESPWEEYEEEASNIVQFPRRF